MRRLGLFTVLLSVVALPAQASRAELLTLVEQMEASYAGVREYTATQRPLLIARRPSVLGLPDLPGSAGQGRVLAFSVVLALAVLLARLHYSIDVVAAYFITYAIYRAEIHWLPAPGVSGTRRRVAPG